MDFENCRGPRSEPGTHLSPQLAPGQGVLAPRDHPRKYPSPPSIRLGALAGGPAWCPAVCAQTALTWVPACSVAPGSCAVPRSAPPAPNPVLAHTPVLRGWRGKAYLLALCRGQAGARGPPAQTAFRNLAWRAVSEAPEAAAGRTHRGIRPTPPAHAEFSIIIIRESLRTCLH